MSAQAVRDMADTWQLVYAADGDERADKVLAVMEVFCRSLTEFAEIGTKHDDRKISSLREWPG